jgi:uncharacterized repeat protein (TIGR02543 family)
MKKKEVFMRTLTLSHAGAAALALALAVVLAGCASPTGSSTNNASPEAAAFVQTLEDWGAAGISASGDTVTLSGAAQIPAGESMVVPEKVRLVIAGGAELTLDEGAAVEVYGALILEEGAAATGPATGTITVKAGGVSENGGPESAAAATWIYESGCTADVMSAFTLPEGARVIATARENGAPAYEFVPGTAVDPFVLNDPWTLGEGASLSINGKFTIAAPLTIAKDATFAIGSKAAVTLGDPAADIIFQPGCTVQVAKEASIEAPDTSLAAVEKGKENTVIQGGYIIPGKDLGDNFTPGSEAGEEGGPGGDDEEESFTVHFDAQGGSPVGDQTVASGGKAVEPHPAPAREGYIPGGWHKEAECIQPWDFAVDTVTGPVTLYAKWTPEEPAPPAFVPVTGIAGAPATGTKGLAVDLTTAAVEPGNATRTTIRWTLANPGGTGVVQEDLEDGSFTPAASGTITLTATVEDGAAVGKAFTKKIYIAISEGPADENPPDDNPPDDNPPDDNPPDDNPPVDNPPDDNPPDDNPPVDNPPDDNPPVNENVAVIGLSGAPEAGEARQALSLAAVTALPPEANQAIQWSIVDPGTTGLVAGAIAGSSVTPPAFGTLILRATIAGGNADGSAYAGELTIPIAKSSNANLQSLTPSAGTIQRVGGSDVYWEVSNLPFEVENITFTVVKQDSGATTGSLGPWSLTPGGSNTCVITVTAENGATTKTYSIQVMRAAQSFFPVAGIANVPATGKVNRTVSLAAATVSPANASNKTIVWTVVSSHVDGVSPGDLTGNSFVPTGAGAVTVRASIANGLAAGTPYVSDDFTILITPLEDAGTAEISIGFGYGAITIAGNEGANIIKQSGAPSSLALSAAGYESCRWYVDGSDTPASSTNSVTIAATDHALGLHWVVFVGTVNGTAYSQRIPFTVAR